jgi:hypothetical protein
MAIPAGAESGGIDVTIRLEGLEQIQEKLKKENLLSKPLKMILEQGALTIERKAKEFSPVDLGRLKGSMTHQLDASSVPLWSKAGTNVEYAAPLEYSNKRPRKVGRIPFFRPAIEESREKVEGFIKEASAMIEERFGGTV